MQSNPPCNIPRQISLSPGGSDASITREFDLSTKAWVGPEASGFELLEPAKTDAGFRSRNELLVCV